MPADIRPARHGELDELARILEHAAPNICPVPSRAALERAQAAGELFVLADDDELLGCVRLDRVEPPEYGRVPWEYAAAPGRALVVHALHVLPEHARRGHGTRFMRFALARARELGCTVVRLDAWGSATAALGLYDALGFHTAARAAVLRDGTADEQVFLERRV